MIVVQFFSRFYPTVPYPIVTRGIAGGEGLPGGPPAPHLTCAGFVHLFIQLFQLVEETRAQIHGLYLLNRLPGGIQLRIDELAPEGGHQLNFMRLLVMSFDQIFRE